MKERAVFFDRDGTINREARGGVVRGLGWLRILPRAAEAISKLNRLGFLVVVVTNQTVVSRGIKTEEELDEIHAVLVRRLARKGAKIDAIYYCPHHPEATLKQYRMRCGCRKPNIGMIMKAARKYGVNLKKSFMVGDSTRDILAGKKAGLKTILVKTGYGGKDGKYAVAPDFIARDLMQAANIIKRNAR